MAKHKQKQKNKTTIQVKSERLKCNMKKVAIMQPYFLPYIGYWQLINVVDEYVIGDDVNFIKKGWINRNRMLIDNEAKLFNIPIVDKSSNKLINQIEVLQENYWKDKLLKKIRNCYSKAPYYKEIYPIHSPNGMFCKWHVRPTPYCTKCENYQRRKYYRSLEEIVEKIFQEGIKEVKGGVKNDY